MFLINTGCRIGEAGALRVRDINFKKKLIYIGWTLAKNDYKAKGYEGIYFSFNRQKGANDRYIPINSAILNILEDACKEKKSTDLVFTNQPQTSRKVVFRDGNNKEELLDLPIINTQHFSNTRFKSLQKQINIPEQYNIGAHGLRHTFASHYVMNGGDLYILSKILGHSSIKITEVYAHLSPKHKLDLESFVNFSF